MPLCPGKLKNGGSSCGRFVKKCPKCEKTGCTNVACRLFVFDSNPSGYKCPQCGYNGSLKDA